MAKRTSRRVRRRTPKIEARRIGAKARRSAAKAAGERFQELTDTMARLRAPGGCPWDREQTLASLRPYVLEETYEVLDAIDRGDIEALRGEIGDLIFEGVFLAQICADEGRFTVADSLRAVTDKLVRRHPHVFGQKTSLTSRGVKTQWEQIKADEQGKRGERRSVLGGVKRTLPALLRAYEIGGRVGAVGFDWARADDVVAKVREEVEELAEAVGTNARDRAEEEMGDLLFALANLARKLRIEPESALRRANEKFTARFEALERRFESEGRSIHGATLAEMESRWQELKKKEAPRSAAVDGSPLKNQPVSS
jgi:nucleoside triphosphate diphosphatase